MPPPSALQQHGGEPLGVNETLSDLRELAVWPSERAYARDEGEGVEEVDA
jgi:hypothetical protein